MIQPPLVSVPSCGKKISQSSVHEFLMQSWFWFVQNCRLWFVMPSKLDLLKTVGRDLWCEASLNGIQIFIRRCKANLTGSPNWGGGSKQGGAHRHRCWLHHCVSENIVPQSDNLNISFFIFKAMEDFPSQCWLNFAAGWRPVKDRDYWSPPPS